MGVDVSKARIDVALLPEGEALVMANDDGGLEDLVSRLQSLTPGVIVPEATGGYELEAWTVLSSAGLPVAVMNPRQVREFACATGRLAKTDKIDAVVLGRSLRQWTPSRGSYPMRRRWPETVCAWPLRRVASSKTSSRTSSAP